MIVLSYFTYFVEGALKLVAQYEKKGKGSAENSHFLSRALSDVIQHLEISVVKRYCILCHLQSVFTKDLFSRAWILNCRQPLIAGMYLMMSVNTVIPPGEKGESQFYKVIFIISASDLFLLLFVEENLAET